MFYRTSGADEHEIPSITKNMKAQHLKFRELVMELDIVEDFIEADLDSIIERVGVRSNVDVIFLLYKLMSKNCWIYPTLI